MKQGVKTHGIQYYTTHKELILSDYLQKVISTTIAIVHHFFDWEIEKTPEAHPEKLEFNINKPEKDLKKIDFNINANGNEIDAMNDKEAVHPSGDLTDGEYSNIKDHETQHKQTNSTLSSRLVSEST